MAYDSEKKLKEALEAIRKEKLWWIEEVVAYIGVSRDWFYRTWPRDSEEYDIIIKELNKYRLADKILVRKQLKKSAQAGGLFGLYKILGTPEERKKLSTTYQEIRGEDEDQKAEYIIDTRDLPTELLEQLENYFDEIKDEN